MSDEPLASLGMLGEFGRVATQQHADAPSRTDEIRCNTRG